MLTMIAMNGPQVRFHQRRITQFDQQLVAGTPRGGALELNAGP
jgi:hypothetical protein